MKKGIVLAVSCLFALGACVFTGCDEKKGDTPTEEIEVYMPDGAPALSMAKFMAEDRADDGVSYHVVDAGTVAKYVTGNAPQADLCVLPLNAASKLLGSGDAYRLLGTVTHGNLYMLSTEESATFYDGASLSSLVGKTVGVIQIANVPGLVFKTVLNRNGVQWQELTGSNTPSATAVNLQGIADPKTGVSPAGGCDYYVAAEPLVSAKVAGTANAMKPLKLVGDLQSVYGEGGYPQAVLVGKTSFLQSHREWVSDFTEAMPEAATWLATAETDVVVSAVSSRLTEGLAPTFSAKNLSAEVISRCGISYSPAGECKGEITSFLSYLAEISPAAVGTVSDEFFYGV